MLILDRALDPLIDRRDVLAMCHNNLSSTLHGTLDTLTLQQVENLRVMNANRSLTAELIDLAGQLKDHELDDIQDAALLARLRASEADAKEARRQYRIIKGVVGGLIASSGVDWAKNEQLRSLVLDAED